MFWGGYLAWLQSPSASTSHPSMVSPHWPMTEQIPLRGRKAKQDGIQIEGVRKSVSRVKHTLACRPAWTAGLTLSDCGNYTLVNFFLQILSRAWGFQRNGSTILQKENSVFERFGLTLRSWRSFLSSAICILDLKHMWMTLRVLIFSLCSHSSLTSFRLVELHILIVMRVLG